MAEAPFWTVLLVPLGLLAVALFAASLDSVLTASAAGRRLAAVEVTAPIRETVRLLVRQRRRPARADVPLWQIGGAGIVVAAVLAAVVIPVGGWVVSDLSVGVVWFNAMEVLLWALVWMVGWGANSAYSLVGGYRFLAQALAYELPLMFALTGPPLAADSLRVGAIVAAQEPLWFVVWMPAAFAAYLLGVLGIAFWGPLGQPAASDIAGGVTAELSGVDRLLVQAGRYLVLAVGAAFAVPLFLGGGHGPWLPEWVWSVVKTLAVVALLVWVGRRTPLVRPERLMLWGWVVVLPVVLAQILIVGVIVLMGAP